MTDGGHSDGGANIKDANVRDASAADAKKPDGGTSPTGNPYVYTLGEDIQLHQLDMGSGILTFKSKLNGRGNGLWLDPTGKYLYTIGDGSVSTYSVDPKTALIEAISSASTDGAGASSLWVHPTGKWVFVSHYTSGTLSVLPVSRSGMLGRADVYATGIQAHDVITDDTGKFLFVPCLGSNFVAQYVVDTTTGKLTSNAAPYSPTISGGPRNIAFHPNQKFVYVISEGGSTVTSLKYDGATGGLSDPQTIPSTPNGAGANGHVAVAPSGKYVYTSNRRHGSIGIFSVNEITGRLTLVGYETAGELLLGADWFVIDPTGKYMIATPSTQNNTVGHVLVFEIGADGKLVMKDNKDLPYAGMAIFVSLP